MHNARNIVKAVAARCPGGRLPHSYLVLDIETSGLYCSPPPGDKPDVIVQLGYAAVNEGKLIASGGHYVKRPMGTMRPKASAVNGITDVMLAEVGKPPTEVFSSVLELINNYMDAGCMFMGHNFVAFDKPFMETEFGRHNLPLEFPRNRSIDTGMIFKASQMGVMPSEHEDLTTFFNRIRHERSRVRWKLTLAAEKFGLLEKHNLNLDDAHDAGFDCRLTHYFFEEMRQWLRTPEGIMV
jgi:DNA polymerase III epsilon subunit-like protein